MPPKCTNRQPTFRINMHVPATSWHPHVDRTLEAKAPTEFEAWALAQRKMLMELTQGNLRLMIGYWGDALNVLPPDVRAALIPVLARGLGLNIQQAGDDPNVIEVSLVQRYEPLVGEKQTPSGLVVPKEGASDLVLPGDPRYHGKRR